MPQLAAGTGGMPRGFSAWQTHGTHLGVGLRFARCPMAAWQPPAPPVKKLEVRLLWLWLPLGVVLVVNTL